MNLQEKINHNQNFREFCETEAINLKKVTMNPIVLGVISGVGLIVKTASEMKNLKSKIEMSKFAFTTYEKTLSDLRFALRGGNFDRTEFLSSMEAIDGIVIDLGLDWEKFENKWKEKFSME